MAWHDDSAHPFAGIAEKLKRANESIDNLASEVRRFFNECDYPRIPHPKNEKWQDAINYHQSLLIPRRFSILAGEIIHHWRSCLDHIVWIYSAPDYRISNETAIQFPVFVKPLDANDLKRYKRQIGGIADPSTVRDLIWKMQPCSLTADPISSPIAIVHQMDIIDKHRELVIVLAVGESLLVVGTPGLIAVAEIPVPYSDQKSISFAERYTLDNALQDESSLIPQVAFANFGQRENQLLIPSLQQLRGAIENIIANFVKAGN